MYKALIVVCRGDFALRIDPADQFSKGRACRAAYYNTALNYAITLRIDPANQFSKGRAGRAGVSPSTFQS